MKKLLFTFLAVMCCMAMNAQTAFEVNGIKYSVTGENTVEVVIKDPSYSGTVVIPSAVTYSNITYNVTGIGDGAFQFCTNLTSINIPYSVTSIGDWAFPAELNSITVDIENSVYDSRYNCNAIIETATNTLIAGCKNTIIPSDVTRIGNDAFRGCLQLTSVTIPSGLTYIGDNAFMNCWGLTEIYVLATTPPTLGYDAFWGVPTGIPVYVPDVETYSYTDWGGFTNLIKNVDLPTAKEEAIADLQTYFNEEKIANAPMEEYESRINAATAVKDIPSIVNNIKAEISNYTKFTLGEWKYLLDDNDGEYTIVGDELTFTDKDLYQSDYDFTVDGSITYIRSFKATGVWQAWFVPFEVTVSDMNAAGMEVAEIAGVLMDEKEPYIAFAKMTDTDAIVKANTPYVVKAKKSSVSMTLTGPDMCIRKSTSTELEAKRLTVQSSYNTFTFGGNYQPTNGYANEWYALNTSGVFQKMGDGANLAPQRFWMTIDTRTDTPYYTDESGAATKEFINFTVWGDDEPTGIETIDNGQWTIDNSQLYDLQGQKVTSIQKGQVYIMNGKKFFAK